MNLSELILEHTALITRHLLHDRIPLWVKVKVGQDVPNLLRRSGEPQLGVDRRHFAYVSALDWSTPWYVEDSEDMLEDMQVASAVHSSTYVDLMILGNNGSHLLDMAKSQIQGAGRQASSSSQTVAHP